jgi:hypothetical protein
MRKIADRTPGVPSPYGEDFYERLIEDLYDGVDFVDLDRRITYWNQAADPLTGDAAAEVWDRCCSENILVSQRRSRCEFVGHWLPAQPQHPGWKAW